MSHLTKNRQGLSKALPIFMKPGFPGGFTVVEIIIVVAIMSTLSGIAILSISLIFSRQLDGDARKLLADIYWTREMTASKHTDYIFSINTSDKSYTVTDSGGNTIRTTQRLKSDITAAPATITFQAPFATAALNPAGASLITLRNNTKQKSIRLYTETGYAKIQ